MATTDILDGIVQTGTGSVVRGTSPTLATPALGTPTSGTLTSCIGLPLTTGITGILGAANGGTGTANNAASTLTISGSFASTFTISGITTVTFPTTGTLTTLATVISTANTWTAVQTFTNSDIKLLGSSTGATTFTSANASATNYTLTFPAITDTLATLTATQTLTNKTITGNVNSQTGTTYTFVASDFVGRVLANNTAAQTYTLPQQSTLATAAGVGVWLENIGVGSITIIKEGTETLYGNSLLKAGGTVYLYRDTTTSWGILDGTPTISEQMTGSITGATANQAYDISVQVPFDGTIMGITTKSTTTTTPGTYTVAINGVSVTGLTTIANGATGVRTRTDASAANAFVRGNYITITLAGATITDLFWALEYTRTI